MVKSLRFQSINLGRNETSTPALLAQKCVPHEGMSWKHERLREASEVVNWASRVYLYGRPVPAHHHWLVMH